MNADTRRLKHKELTETIIGVFYDVYNELGHGFLESVYEKAFEVALKAKGLNVCCQIAVPVWFRGHRVGDFTADLLVESSVLLELKAVRTLDSAHEAQLLNYLGLRKLKLAFCLTLASNRNSNALRSTTPVRRFRRYRVKFR